MKSSGRSLSLTSYDDLFSTDATREDASREKVMEIPLSELYPFKDHPFKVKDDEDMLQLVESVRERGIITPITLRQKEDGRYEIISGHRRRRACEIAGLETIPAEIKELSRDEAIILMVESNLQRSVILPSEKAFSYKMRLEAMKRLPGRPSKEKLTSSIFSDIYFIFSSSYIPLVVKLISYSIPNSLHFSFR